MTDPGGAPGLEEEGSGARPAAPIPGGGLGKTGTPRILTMALGGP